MSIRKKGYFSKRDNTSKENYDSLIDNISPFKSRTNKHLKNTIAKYYQ
jgi:hypothetical protein